MYQKIYVAVDGSAHGQKAADAAIALGHLFGAEVVGGHVDEAAHVASRRQQLRDQLRATSTSPGSAEPLGVGVETADTAAALDVVRTAEAVAGAAGVAYRWNRLSGRAFEALTADIGASGGELVVVGAIGRGGASALGSVCERLVRQCHVDTLVIKDAEKGAGIDGPGNILVCVDGSQQSYAGLRAALALGKKLGKTVEALGVYDPYLHYTLFNGIVTVLSEQASKVFKFKDQEKLHEEIIDTGLAKIYQAHLEVARQVAAEEGVTLKITLLDGKAYQKILQHVRKTDPWLLVMGRIGVHSKEDMDVGATSENLLRAAPCNTLVCSRMFAPAIDVLAAESVEWTPEAKKKMGRVPDFVRGIATTAILRWAMERGHSVITPSVINGAMGDLLPPGAAQAMGYVAEELALTKDKLDQGTTFICAECGYVSRDLRPVACPVCKSAGATFEQIDRQAIEAAGRLDPGSLVEEETFDGVPLQWESGAKEVLRRVPSGYERRRSKARIEKTARVRGLSVVTKQFALDMVQQELADGSYLSSRGETVAIEVKGEERPDDAVPRPREGSPLQWTDAAWARMCRVPEGFMRDMTREKVEEVAAMRQRDSIDLALCEEGIAEGRRMMAEALKSHRPGPPRA